METASTTKENCIFDGLQVLRCRGWVDQLEKDGCRVSAATAQKGNAQPFNPDAPQFACVRVTTPIACSIDTFAAFIAAPHNTASYEPDVLFQEIVDVDQNGDATVVHTGYGSAGRDYVTVNRSRLIPLSEGTQRNPLLAQLNGTPSSLVFVFVSRSVSDKRVPVRPHFKRGCLELSTFIACDRGEEDRMHIDVSYVRSFEGNVTQFEGSVLYDFCISHCVKLAKVRELCEALQRMVLGNVLSLKKWSGHSDGSEREDSNEFVSQRRRRRAGRRAAKKSYFSSSSSSSENGGDSEYGVATQKTPPPLQEFHMNSSPQVVATAPSPTLSSLANTPSRAANTNTNLFREQPLFSATPFALMSTAQRMILAPLVLLHRSACWRPRCTINECFVEEASVPFMLHKTSRVSTRIACRLPTLKAVLEDLTYAWQYDVNLTSFMILASDSVDADGVGEGAVQSRRYEVARKIGHATGSATALQSTLQCELRTVSAIVELNSEEAQREGLPNAGEITYIHSAVDWMGGGDGIDSAPTNTLVVRGTVHCMGFVASAERDLEGPVQLSHLVCVEFPTPAVGSGVLGSSGDFEAVWAPDMECARLATIRKLCETRERTRGTLPASPSAPCTHRYGGDAEEEFYDEVEDVRNRDVVGRPNHHGASGQLEMEDSDAGNRDRDGLIASTISACDDSYYSNTELGDLATDPEYASTDDTTGIASPAVPASAIQRLYMSSTATSASESSEEEDSTTGEEDGEREVLTPDDVRTDSDEGSVVDSVDEDAGSGWGPLERGQSLAPARFHRTDAVLRVPATPNTSVPTELHVREVLVAEDDSDDNHDDGDDSLVGGELVDFPNDARTQDESESGAPPPTIVAKVKRSGKVPFEDTREHVRPRATQPKPQPQHADALDQQHRGLKPRQLSKTESSGPACQGNADRTDRRTPGMEAESQGDLKQDKMALGRGKREGQQPKPLQSAAVDANSATENDRLRAAAQRRCGPRDVGGQVDCEQEETRKGPSPPVRAASRYAIEPGKRHLRVVVDRCTELPLIRNGKGAGVPQQQQQQPSVMFVTVETSVDKQRTLDALITGRTVAFDEGVTVEIGSDISNERVTITAVAVIAGVGVRRLGTCVLSLNVLPVNNAERELNVSLVHNAGRGSARERGQVHLTLHSSNFGNASAPSDAMQDALRERLKPLLLRNAREELHLLEWYVGEYCERLTDIPALLERFGETAALEAQQEIGVSGGDKAGRVLTVTVNDVRTLTTRKGIPSQCTSCYVIIRSSGGTVQTKVIPYRRVATFNETFSLRIARPSRECLYVSVFSSTHKFGECVVSVRALQRDAPLQRTHMIINAAGTPQAMPCGFISLTLRSTEFGCRRRRFVASRDEATRMRFKNFMWKYTPEELHKLDVVVSNVGDVEAFMKTMVDQYGAEPPAQRVEVTISRLDGMCGMRDAEGAASTVALLGETSLPGSATSAKRSRLPLQHPSLGHVSRGGVDAVPFALPDVAAASVGSIIAQSIRGGPGVAVGSSGLARGLAAQRSSSSSSPLLSSATSRASSPSASRLPMLYVVVRCGLEQYQTRSVRCSPEGCAIFNESCFLHVSDPAKEEVLVVVMCEEAQHDTEVCRMVFSMRTLEAAKPSNVHAQLVARSHTKLAQFHGTVDARFVSHGFGLAYPARTPEAERKFRTDLTRLLYRNVPEQLHRLEYLISHYVDREQTIVNKLIAEHGGGENDTASIVVRVLGIRHWAVTGKTYIKAYLDGVPLLRTSDSHGTHDLAFTAESKNSGTAELRDPQRSVVRFKIAQHKFFQSVPLAYAEISVRCLEPNAPNVWWVPLFSVSTGAALGTLGVDLQSAAFVGKRREYTEAVAIEGVIQDITTLVCKYNPRLAYRVQPLIAQAPSIRDAHSELRSELAPWPIAATVYLKVERIEMLREEDKEPVLRGNISTILSFGGETMRSTLQKDTNPLSVAPNMLQMPLFRLDIPEQRVLTTSSEAVDGQHALELIVNECVQQPHGAPGSGTGRRHGGGAFASGAAALAHLQLPREKEIGRALISLRALLTPELFSPGESITIPIVHSRRCKSSQGQSALDNWRSSEVYVAGEVTVRATMPTFERAPRWLHFDPEKMQRIDRAYIQHYRRRISAFLSAYHPESLLDYTYTFYERDVASGQWPLSLPDWMVSLVKRFGPERDIFSPPPELVFDAEQERRAALEARVRQSNIKQTACVESAAASGRLDRRTRRRCMDAAVPFSSEQCGLSDDAPRKVKERTIVTGSRTRGACADLFPVSRTGNMKEKDAAPNSTSDEPRAPEDTSTSCIDDDSATQNIISVGTALHHIRPISSRHHRTEKRDPARRRTRTYGGTASVRIRANHHAADDMTMFYRRRPLDY